MKDTIIKKYPNLGNDYIFAHLLGNDESENCLDYFDKKFCFDENRPKKHFILHKDYFITKSLWNKFCRIELVEQFLNKIVRGYKPYKLANYITYLHYPKGASQGARYFKFPDKLLFGTLDGDKSPSIDLSTSIDKSIDDKIKTHSYANSLINLGPGECKIALYTMPSSKADRTIYIMSVGQCVVLTPDVRYEILESINSISLMGIYILHAHTRFFPKKVMI